MRPAAIQVAGRILPDIVVRRYIYRSPLWFYSFGSVTRWEFTIRGSRNVAVVVEFRVVWDAKSQPPPDYARQFMIAAVPVRSKTVARPSFPLSLEHNFRASLKILPTVLSHHGERSLDLFDALPKPLFIFAPIERRRPNASEEIINIVPEIFHRQQHRCPTVPVPDMLRDYAEQPPGMSESPNAFFHKRISRFVPMIRLAVACVLRQPYRCNEGFGAEFPEDGR